MLVISYKPLLEASPMWAMGPRDEEEVRNFLLQWQHFPSPSCYGLAWNDTHKVIIVIDRYKEVHDHLVRWSEGNPAEWFTFLFRKVKSGYAFALHPNLTKSIERNRQNYQIIHGQGLPKDDQDHFLYEPISSFCFTHNTLNKLPCLPQKGETVDVYFADKVAIDQSGSVDDLPSINGIKVNAYFEEYLDNVIKGAQEDTN